MRIRSKRRRFLCILKLIIFCLFFIILYHLGLSFFRVKQIILSDKIKPVLFVVENEEDSFDLWSNLTEGRTERSKTLFTINSHCDDGLYMVWNKTFLHINSLDDILYSLANIPLHTLYPAVSGFVSKIVCIYPWWKNTNDVFSNKTHYVGAWQEYICLCSFGYNETNINNETLCKVIQGGIDQFLSPVDCQPFSNRWESIAMQDVYAQTLLKDSTVTDPTILIINLDFFTVDEGMLLISKDILAIIEKKISLLICPTRIEDENVIDICFRRILSLSNSMSFNGMRGLLDNANLSLCTDDKVQNNVRLKSLLSTLRVLSKDQRHQLSKVGLCISSLPNQHIPTLLTLRICSNQLARLTNLHNRAHSAGKSEISLQMEKLMLFLKQSVREPLIVTLVRSTRQGLVSPANQTILESLLLDQLLSLYNINVTNVIFHSKLLGGVQGWSNRE